MKLTTRHSSTRDTRDLTLEATARVDRRLAGALRRARPGDVVVVDHVDLDRSGAEAVIEAGVAAVVNAAPFISGRYPNLGPEMLVRAGVLLVEAPDDVLRGVRDGATVGLDDGTVLVRGQVVAQGRPLDLETVRREMDDARGGLSTQLASLVHNAAELLRRDEDLVLHGLGLPDLDVDVAGRPVVVVVRALEHRAELQGLRRFVREQRPVLVGVDAGADALLEAGLRPDVLILGAGGLGGPGADHGTEVSDRALTEAREVVLHADAADRLPGADRLDRVGVRARRVATGAATEDVALLLAAHRDASLVVTVGTHTTLDELLDRQRGGTASSFLTRMRVGPLLVDAKAVPALYTGRVRTWHLLLAVLVGLLAVGVALAATPVGGEWADDVVRLLRDLPATVTGALR